MHRRAPPSLDEDACHSSSVFPSPLSTAAAAAGVPDQATTTCVAKVDDCRYATTGLSIRPVRPYAITVGIDSRWDPTREGPLTNGRKSRVKRRNSEQFAISCARWNSPRYARVGRRVIAVWHNSAIQLFRRSVSGVHNVQRGIRDTNRLQRNRGQHSRLPKENGVAIDWHRRQRWRRRRRRRRWYVERRKTLVVYRCICWWTTSTRRQHSIHTYIDCDSHARLAGYDAAEWRWHTRSQSHRDHGRSRLRIIMDRRWTKGTDDGPTRIEGQDPPEEDGLRPGLDEDASGQLQTR